jgi:hypothetical protein
MMIGGMTLTPGLALVGVVVVVIVAVGLFRFLLRLAWRLVGIVLTLAVIAGIFLFLTNAIHIR